MRQKRRNDTLINRLVELFASESEPGKCRAVYYVSRFCEEGEPKKFTCDDDARRYKLYRDMRNRFVSGVATEDARHDPQPEP